MDLILESKVGYDLLATSSEAADYLKTGLTQLKKWEDVVVKPYKGKIYGKARRYSGRDIRNIQIYRNKVALGSKSVTARDYVMRMDAFLEEVYHETSDRFDVDNIKELEQSITKISFHDIKPDPFQIYLPKHSQSIAEKEKEVDAERVSRLVYQGFATVSKLHKDLKKLGFLVSLDTYLKCILYVIQGATDSIEVEMRAKLRERKENEAKESPIESLEKLLSRNK